MQISPDFSSEHQTFSVWRLHLSDVSYLSFSPLPPPLQTCSSFRVLKRHDYAHCCSSQKPGSCFSLPPSLHESSSLVDAAYVPPTTPPHSLCSLFTGHLSARRAGCALLLLACNLCRHPLCWGHTALSFTQTLPIHLKGAIPDWITSLNT